MPSREHASTPDFGMPRSVALNLGVERGVDADLLQPLAKPGVPWVANAPVASSSEQGPAPVAPDPWRPAIPVPTGAVEEWGIAESVGFVSGCIAKPR